MFKFLLWLWMVMALLHLVSPRRYRVDYCKRKCPAFDPPHGAVLLPGPQKNLFYKCNFGIGILFSCPRGTYFNPKINVCDWPRNARAVRCRGSPDYEPEGSGDFEGVKITKEEIRKRGFFLMTSNKVLHVYVTRHTGQLFYNDPFVGYFRVYKTSILKHGISKIYNIRKELEIEILDLRSNQSQPRSTEQI